MTGFTALQRGPQRQPNGVQKIDVPASVAEALRSLGHEVDWRPVQVGEDLERYDAGWVNLARPISMNSRVGALGALWALASGLPCVGFYDDWQAPLTVQGDCTLMTRRPRFLQKQIVDPKAVRERYEAATGKKIVATVYSPADAQRAVDDIFAATGERARAYRFYEADWALVERHRDILDAAVSGLATGRRWAAGLVPACPMYAWGDRSVVQDILPEGSGELVSLDPSETTESTLQHGRDTARGATKREEWLLAALMPAESFVRKLQATWPVHNTGSVTLIRKLGQGERLKTELEVIERYAERWGALSPPYEHAGSGWWRSRFLYAAATGTVMVADPAEVAALGAAYALTCRDAEGMTPRERRRVARDQGDALQRLASHEGSFAEAADRAVRRAEMEDRWWWEDAR